MPHLALIRMWHFIQWSVASQLIKCGIFTGKTAVVLMLFMAKSCSESEDTKLFFGKKTFFLLRNKSIKKLQSTDNMHFAKKYSAFTFLYILYITTSS